MLSAHRNPNGTYNGVTAMAEWSGLSAAEIKWTWDRLQCLIRAEGKSKEEAKAIVKAESVNKPWEVRQ